MRLGHREHNIGRLPIRTCEMLVDEDDATLALSEACPVSDEGEGAVERATRAWFSRSMWRELDDGCPASNKRRCC